MGKGIGGIGGIGVEEVEGLGESGLGARGWWKVGDEGIGGLRGRWRLEDEGIGY